MDNFIISNSVTCCFYIEKYQDDFLTKNIIGDFEEIFSRTLYKNNFLDIFLEIQRLNLRDELNSVFINKKVRFFHKTLTLIDNYDREKYISMISSYDEEKELIESFLTDITTDHNYFHSEIVQNRLEVCENFFKDNFYSSSDVMSISRLKDGLYIDVSAGFAKVYGYEKEEIIGKTSIELGLWPNGSKQRDEFIKILSKCGRLESFETSLFNKNKKLISGLVSAYIIKVYNEPHVLTIKKDITKMKDFEKYLINEKNYIQDIIDSQQNMIITTNKLETISCNRSFLDFFLVSTLEEFKNETKLVSQRFINYDNCISSGPNWIKRVLSNKQERIESMVVMYCNTRLEERIFSLTMNRLSGIEGRYIITFNDVTDSVKYQTSLEEQKLSLEKLVEIRTKELIDKNSQLIERNNQFEESQEIANIGSWCFDLIDQKLNFSKQTYKIFKLKDDDLITLEKFLNIFDEQTRDLINQKLKDLFMGKKVDETLLKVNLDTTKYISFIGNIKRSQDGYICTIFGTFQDVTKMIEIQNKQKLQERLFIQQSKMATMGEMIGIIGHQWKQPLNSLSLIVSDLEDAYLSNEVDAKYISQIKNDCLKQISFMSHTIDDFRKFYVPDKKEVVIDIKSILFDVVELIGKQITKINISLNIYEDKSYKKNTILGYPNDLKQVFLNLITNAKDAIIKKREEIFDLVGEIKITLSANEKYTIINICDNGGGINNKDKEKIFNVYFTTKGENGTGLGLNLSQMIVREHFFGEISFENIDNGVCFIVRLKNI